jgi:hypothetical protein
MFDGAQVPHVDKFFKKGAGHSPQPAP